MRIVNNTAGRFVLGFVAVVGIAFAVLSIFSSDWFVRWVGERRIEKVNRQIIEEYKKDTAGGKTPYETFDLFLAALENGDVQSASRFFVLDEQEEQFERLREMQSDGTLAAQIERWKDARDTFEEVRDEYFDWEKRASIAYKFQTGVATKKTAPDGKGGTIEFTIPPGSHESEINFLFNSYSKVWKIE